MYDRGLWPIIYINHDIGLTLINLTSMSNMVMKAFEWENVETLEFP